MPLLDIKNLRTTFSTQVGQVRAVRGLNLTVDYGESVGIVGESGSGKSVSMLSVMGLLPVNAHVNADSIMFDGRELTTMDEREKRKMHGSEIGMVFQDPMTSLNPLHTIGMQLMEPIKLHMGLNKAQARARALEMLKLVNIPSPESRLKQYPHEFSGGMRQRVMIAIALACNPKLIIADEPTTALDVTIQAQILELMQGLKNQLNTSIIMITHDLGVIASMCSRIVVMYGGCVAETGTTREIFYSPKHPYTWGLLRSIPKAQMDGTHSKLLPIPGTPPDMLRPPKGCPFAPRCPYAMQVCREYMAPETVLSDTHRVSCHLMHKNAPKVTREEV
ncbi:MAG: ABC transporter ATP-binding protein [Clostridiales bacterium]|nr:ABC transporter ATP-binding protein [Clostridiales bacterium]